MKITRQKLKQIISEELGNLGEGWFGADTSDLQRDYETPAERSARFAERSARMQREYDEEQAEADRLRRAYEDSETFQDPETFQGEPDPSQWPDPDEGGWGEFEGDIVDPGEYPETTEFDIEAELGDLPRSTQAKVLRALQKRSWESPETTEFDIGAELEGLPRSSLEKILRAVVDLPAEPRPSRRPRADVGPQLAGLSGVGAAPMSRAEARRAARKRGDLTYTWNGKTRGTRGRTEDDIPAWKRKMARIRARASKVAPASVGPSAAGTLGPGRGHGAPVPEAPFLEEGQQEQPAKITKTYLEQIIREELGKLI